MAMDTKTIRFIRRGELVSLANVPPERTLLEVLREDLGCTGTKEGCGEGDCGACTVVLGEKDGDGIRYRAINSCIRLAHSIDGMALWTVEDIAAAESDQIPPEPASSGPREEIVQRNTVDVAMHQSNADTESDFAPVRRAQGRALPQ